MTDGFRKKNKKNYDSESDLLMIIDDKICDLRSTAVKGQSLNDPMANKCRIYPSPGLSLPNLPIGRRILDIT